MEEVECFFLRFLSPTSAKPGAIQQVGVFVPQTVWPKWLSVASQYLVPETGIRKSFYHTIFVIGAAILLHREHLSK